MGDAAKRAKFAFVLLNEHNYKVAEMCRVLHVSRRGYHRWKRRRPSAHAVRDAELASGMSRAWEESRRIHGAPKVFRHLSKEGVSTSRERVARMMRERGWAGASRRCAKSPDNREKRVSRKDGAPDLARRHFDGGAGWADGLRLEVAGGPRNGVPHAFLDVRVDGKVRWDGPEPDAP